MTKKTEQFKKDALGFPERANRIIIHDAKTLGKANDFILTTKEMLKEVAGSYDPIISHATAEKKKYSDPLKEGQRIARLRVTSYLEEQAEIQRKAGEKAREEEQKRQKKENDELDRAQKLRDKGKEKKADAIIENLALRPQAPDTPLYVKPAGLSLKRIVDTEKINRLVATTKGQTRIPGIGVYPVWHWEITDRSLIPSSYYKSSMATRAPKEE